LHVRAYTTVATLVASDYTRVRTPEKTPAKLPTTFTLARAMKLGVPRRALQAMLDDGTIERRARGIHALASEPSDDPERAAIALLAPRATICLTSAIARHGLIDATPGTIDIALPRRTRLPATRLPMSDRRTRSSGSTHASASSRASRSRATRSSSS
jgi:hypothetical protein